MFPGVFKGYLPKRKPIFHGIFIGSPTPNPNIKVDIGHLAVSLRCKYPPRDIRQLKAREIPLT
jgi:hypothetical protein